MIALRHWPIRQKLNLAIIGTSTLAIIIASGVLFSYVWFKMQDDILENLNAMGEAIARNSTAAISFQDAQSATETLSAMNAKPEITLACLYVSGQDQVFAHYTAGGSSKCRQKHLAKTINLPMITFTSVFPLFSTASDWVIFTLNVTSPT